MFSSGPLVLMLMIANALALDEKASERVGDMRLFKSQLGGYEVEIPASWHSKEFPRPGVYQAWLSREPIEKAEDQFLYGLDILRINNYSRAFKLEASKPEKLAQEYANYLAGRPRMKQFGNNVLVKLPPSEHGVKTFSYLIGGNQGGEQCIWMTVVVAFKDKEMFRAFWEMPCEERESNQDEIGHMFNSLLIKKKWEGRK